MRLKLHRKTRPHPPSQREPEKCKQPLHCIFHIPKKKAEHTILG